MPSDIKIVAGGPDAPFAAMYLVELTPRQSFHHVTAELYLLDSTTSEHTSLSSEVDDLPQGTASLIKWQLPADDPVGTSWQREKKREFISRRSYATSHAPMILMYLRAEEGIFAITSAQFTIYYAVPGQPEMLQPVKVNQQDGVVRELLKNKGVDLPQFARPTTQSYKTGGKDAQPKAVQGRVGQRLVSGPLAITVDEAKLEPLFNPMDRTGITMGMPRFVVKFTLHSVSERALSLGFIECDFRDGDARHLGQLVLRDEAGGWLLQPGVSDSYETDTDGYGLDPETTVLTITVNADRELVIAGPFIVNIAQRLSPEESAREKKRREQMDAIDRSTGGRQP